MRTANAVVVAILMAMGFNTSCATPRSGETTSFVPLSYEEEIQLSRAIKMNAVSFAFQTAIVFASNAKLLGGNTNAEISEDYPSLMTPAGYAFSIWGVIYTWESLVVAAPFFMALGGAHRTGIVSSSPYFVAANVFQGLWALTFARELITPSTGLLVATAVSMARAVSVMGVTMPRERAFWLLAAPCSLHAGWLAAASIVSFNLALVAHKGSQAAQIGLAFTSLSVALAAGFTAFKQLPPGSDALYSGAISWGLIAIASELHKKILPRIDPSCREGLQGTALLYGGLLTALTLVAAALSGTTWKT
jgi:hypothetical protein